MSQDFLASLGITAGTNCGNNGNWGNYGHHGHRHHRNHDYNSGYNDRRWESHNYEQYSGRRDDATQNWLIGGLIGTVVANSMYPNDPDGARAIGNLANIATSVGLIRDSGRERYQYENHNYGRESNSWRHSQHQWNGGSSNYILEQFAQYGNPWICY